MKKLKKIGKILLIGFICFMALGYFASKSDKKSKSQQPSEADIEAVENERVATKLAEQGTAETANSLVSNNTAEASDEKTQYVYEFVVSGTTYRLSLNVEEESAQLYVEGTYAPNGKTFYGSCKRIYSKKWVIRSGGFTGADDYDITIKDKKNFWDVYQYIDTRNNFIYLDTHSYEAKNPDYRFAIKPIK